jgi:hypothetical protein
MFKYLLDNSFAPVTFDIGFIDVETGDVARKFIEWQELIQKKRGVSLASRRISGELADILRVLEPLTSIERRRHLFVPTNSNWSAYFDNGWRGGDPASVIATLCELHGHRGVRASCVPHKPSKVNGGSQGSVVLEVYGPKGLPILNTERSIFAAYNGSKWEFGTHGKPLPFENIAAYEAKRVRDRFTPELLQKYLGELGIDAFNLEYYCADKGTPAVLVEKRGPIATGAKTYGIEELAQNITKVRSMRTSGK